MPDLASRVILSWGWERRLIAFGAGAFGALAMAPIDFTPALLVSFACAIWLLDGSAGGPYRFSPATLMNAAGAGWWWGFGYFVAGLWWIGAAFLVDADEFLWAMPLGVVALPAGLALFHGLGFMIARLLWIGGPARILSFTVAMAFVEWLRGHIFTGFPWNPFGQSLADYLITAQAASLIGVEGLGIVSLLIFSIPALWAGPRNRQAVAASVAALVILAALFTFGGIRLALNGGFAARTDAEHTMPNVRLRIVQPNISMTARKTTPNGQALLEGYLALSDRPGSPGIQAASHVIWPESPFPFLLAQQPQALKMIGSQLRGKAHLVTGAIRADTGGQPGAGTAYFNAIQVVAPDGSIAQSYDKVHLVPFGEYLPAPFRWIIRNLGLRQFVHVPGGFEGGSIRRPFEIPGLPGALPLICYEAIFADEVTAARTREQFLLNLTNDAWFGTTSGPYQHFAQSRARAIEQGLPLVRAANTGISAVVDGYGRVLAKLPLGVADVIDAPLPRAIAKTVFSSWGAMINRVILLVMLVIVIGLNLAGERRRE